MDEKRELLRHTLAALAYRTARALDGAPEHFAAFDGAVRLPIQILAHMGDLFEWALSVARGKEVWRTHEPGTWPAETQRFFKTLGDFDVFLASDAELHAPIESLMQGPVVDAFTHVGQIAMLRRLAGSPAQGENFYVAAVTIGCVGLDQPEPVYRFK